MISPRSTVAEAIAGAGGVERLDAEVLLALTLSVPRSALYAHPERELAPPALATYTRYLERRRHGEPLAYLTGRREFWSLEIEVSPATLIPRPETELLVRGGLDRIVGQHAPSIADLGTGSGAVALALASERPDAYIVATDRAADALAVARRNALRHCAANLELVQADWLVGLAAAAFDLVVSNPPYVASTDPVLASNGLAYEPCHALAAGPEGLDHLVRIADSAPACLRSGGWLLVEHGAAQGAAVRALLQAAGLQAVTTATDLAGRERVSAGRKQNG